MAETNERSMTRAALTQARWWYKYLTPMIGKKIVSIGLSKDGFPYFIIADGKARFQIEVSCDEEGNRPGFLFGLPKVKCRK